VLRLPRAALASLRAHAQAAFPEEACGFLLGRADLHGTRKEVVLAQEAANQKQDERTRRYLIEPAQLLQAEDAAQQAGLDILGFYHSHPTGVARPSEFDRAHAWPWYSYVIVGVTAGKAGEVASWRLADDRSAFNPEDMVEIGA
jgi:proteasome lid subunit RPN8/RPN11